MRDLNICFLSGVLKLRIGSRFSELIHGGVHHLSVQVSDVGSKLEVTFSEVLAVSGPLFSCIGGLGKVMCSESFLGN